MHATDRFLSRILADLRARAGALAPTSDGRLLDRFVRLRDESAFTELLHRHGRLVLGVARRQLADRHAAEDVFQATFLALARQAARLRPGLPLEGWLHTVAYRLARKERARAARRPRSFSEDVPAFEAKAAADPLAEISGRELVALIDEELARLPECYRLPLLLCGLDGLAREEAAARLGWSLGTLRGRLERGRELLRQRLTQRGLTVPAVLAAGLFTGPANAAPPELIAATTRAALVVPLAATVTVKALAVAAVLVAALGIGTGAACLLGPAQEPPSSPPSPPAAPAKPHVDAFGDPLPERALRRFGTTRFRHGNVIQSFALSPDGATAATGGRGDIRLWDTTTGKLRSTLREHGLRVQALGFSADGSRLLSVSDADMDHKTSKLIVWDLAAGKPLSTVAYSRITSAAITPDSKTVALSSDGTLRILDAGTGEVRHNLGARGGVPNRVAFSPDGKQLAAVRDGAVCLWDVTSGAERLRLRDVPNLWGLAFAPDGKTLVTAELKGDVTKGGSTIRLWDLATGKAKWSVPSEQNWVSSLAFSPDGRRLASSGSDGSVFLRHATNGQPIRRHRELDNSMYGVAFSPDGRSLYAAGTNGRVLVWDTATGEARFPDDQHTAGLLALSQSSDGRTLATAGADRTIRLWDLPTGKTRLILRGHERGVVSVHFLRNGRQLVSAAGDGTVRVWDATTGQELRKLFNPEKGWNARTALSPDGKLLAIGEVKRIRLWDLAAGKEVRQLTGHDGVIVDLSFSADGTYLATAAQSYVGDKDQVSEDLTVRVWKVASGEEVFRHNTPCPRNPVFTSDGRGVAFPVGPYLGDTKVQIFDFRSGKERPSPDWKDVLTMAPSPGGSWLATTHTDGSICIRAAPSGQEVLRFQADAGTVYRLLWSADGKRLYSANGDTTVLEWDLAPPAGGGALTAERAWADLASADGPTAYRAAWWFQTATDPTAALKSRLRAVPNADNAERIRRLIAELDDNALAVREKATKELTALGPAAEPALTRAAAGNASAEVRRRIKTILERSAARELTADECRNLRAVEVLERVANAEARQMLAVLSRGDPDAQLTRAAAAARSRLGSSGRD